MLNALQSTCRILSPPLFTACGGCSIVIVGSAVALCAVVRPVAMSKLVKAFLKAEGGISSIGLLPWFLNSVNKNNSYSHLTLSF